MMHRRHVMKLGLATAEEGDQALWNDLLHWMHATAADFTATLAEPMRA